MVITLILIDSSFHGSLKSQGVRMLVALVTSGSAELLDKMRGTRGNPGRHTAAVSSATRDCRFQNFVNPGVPLLDENIRIGPASSHEGLPAHIFTNGIVVGTAEAILPRKSAGK